MPFKKVGEDDYTGPSGRHFNYAQVKRYYSRGGHFSEGGPVNGYAKGGDIRVGSYAQGGSVLGRTRDFLKETVEFRDPDHGKRKDADCVGVLADKDQDYGHKGSPAKRTGDKSLKAVKPR